MPKSEVDIQVGGINKHSIALREGNNHQRSEETEEAIDLSLQRNRLRMKQARSNESEESSNVIHEKDDILIQHIDDSSVYKLFVDDANC